MRVAETHVREKRGREKEGEKEQGWRTEGAKIEGRAVQRRRRRWWRGKEGRQGLICCSGARSGERCKLAVCGALVDLYGLSEGRE